MQFLYLFTWQSTLLYERLQEEEVTVKNKTKLSNVCNYDATNSIMAGCICEQFS